MLAPRQAKSRPRGIPTAANCSCQDKGPGACRGLRRKDDETVSTGKRVIPPVARLVNRLLDALTTHSCIS